MAKKKKRKYTDICKSNANSGYVLDNAIPIINNTIKTATSQVKAHVVQCIKDLEKGRGSEVKYFYIGKTHIRGKKHHKFDPMNSSTWRSGGIRHVDHCKKKYGIDGLIVLAVITKQSIPEECRKNWYIRNPEEYALALEKRLTEEFVEMDDQRLHETIDPGSIDQGKSVAYAVYMAFTMEGESECNVSMEQSLISSEGCRLEILDWSTQQETSINPNRDLNYDLQSPCKF